MYIYTEKNALKFTNNILYENLYLLYWIYTYMIYTYIYIVLDIYLYNTFII